MKAVLGNGRGFIDIALAAHVPFSEVSGRVSGLLELAGEGGGLWIEPLGHAAFFVILPVVEVGGDSVSVGILSGCQGDAGGGTDGGVDVEVGELDALRCELIDMLGVYLSTKAGEVGVAHVIDEDDDDVGFGS